MQEIVYKNKFYIFIVAIFISFLLVKNVIKVIAMQDLYAAAVLVVQAFVLYQIKIKHRYVKLGIKTWTFFPIIKEGSMLVIYFLYWISGGSENIEMRDFFQSSFLFVTAILIYVFCDKAIQEVKKDFV